MIAKKMTVSGDVQGVSYRYFTRTKAENLGINGWAQNEHDGTVSIFAQGEQEAIDALVAWAHEGSPMATVSEVSVKDAEILPNLKGFEVK